ncbi:MAG: M23 family metallopeptidase [Rudanella sp.]|nr:M23 family metallopeptidase [Rudanella sp.]
MGNRCKLGLKGLVLSVVLLAYHDRKAMAQSRNFLSVSRSGETVQEWIRRSPSEQVQHRFSELFMASPDMAQSIPCLPPLGDWSGNRISSEFGWRNHPTLRVIRHHDGIDIAGPHQYVRAGASGRVATVGHSRSLGCYVRIDHLNSYNTVYGHLAMALVHPGQAVGIGQTLGITGRTGRATGVHLHYSVFKNNVPVNPIGHLRLAIDFVNTYKRQQQRLTTTHQPH